MQRPLAYDVTHLVTRLPTAQTSGIEKVDLAYAKCLPQLGCDALVHYGLWRPRTHMPAKVADLLRFAPVQCPDSGYAKVYGWLTGGAANPVSAPPATASGERESSLWRRRLAYARWRLSPGDTTVPPGAIYLNVAQHSLENARFFNWLSERPDVTGVFFVHDLLPLDWPEYFRPGYKDRFRKRWRTIVRHGRALITTSEAVKARIVRELHETGLPPRAIHVQPLPSPLSGLGDLDDPRLREVPYFIVVGTIEPRKNHLVLLNIWRRMAQEMETPPKLVVVGARGWENEQTLDVLDRSVLVRPHVHEVTGLGERALARLIRNARGLLMPSFAEGYGLPVVEGLSLGTPVVTSDIPVFREIGGAHARYHHPLDGLAWRDTIMTLAYGDRGDSPRPSYVPPDWDGYFAGIRSFLNSL